VKPPADLPGDSPTGYYEEFLCDMKRAPSNEVAPSDSEEETAHNIKLCYQAASPSTGGAQCGGVGPGRLDRRDALECGSRCDIDRRSSQAKQEELSHCAAAALTRAKP